jgi:hypothetical protein
MEKIVASRGEYRGKPRIDIRVYFKPEVSQPDKWLPTKKGINLSPDDWPEFMGLMDRIDQAIGSGGG